MIQFAILLGDAPEVFRQKKLEDMFDFLDSKRHKGDSIVTFANGISELMLEMVLDNSVKQLSDSVVEPAETTSKGRINSILLYICTTSPVKDSDKSFWLSGEEIRRDVIRHYQRFAEKCGIDMQVVFDAGSELVSEEELGWEKVENCNSDFSLKVDNVVYSDMPDERGEK